MNPNTMKKRIISSIAFTLALSAGSLAFSGSSAHAQGTAPAQQLAQQQAEVDQSADEQGKGHRGRKWPIVEESANILGIDKEAMMKSLKDGKSIVQIAAEKGVSEADLTAKLQQLRTSKIEAAVKDGQLTAEQGDHMKQRLNEHLKFILNEKNLFAKEQHGKWHRHGLKPDKEKLAQTLGMSKEELRAQLKAGKSLTEIAKAKGMSKDKLVATIKEQLTPSIEQMVDRKWKAE
ncbi:hypothetical protein [Paenibacillus aestuarii]|uniref:LysM domain-containing protein n=1 Tax=Paenibacillus aestuarii TaxID=516965 RepID=A0ABW0KIS7_9BACL|nr:hypothetical protein [Paenibacillus aestuarii]